MNEVDRFATGVVENIGTDRIIETRMQKHLLLRYVDSLSLVWIMAEI